ncbi:MAG: ribose-phosphate pyrophosphokinase, partial [Firmicutes bacterium]|nr:ribose-phosphate pyrophosphokinase [Bacillota bacterium]
MDRLNKSVIEKVFCLDTIEIGSEKMKKSNGKIVQFSAAKIFADAITSIHGEQSISRLYD